MYKKPIERMLENKKVVFTKEKFIEAIKNSKKNSVIIFDEVYED